ncbi:MAG: hypothetical protein A3I66_05740 [Burkholderiales bacterium RIFCSPLOWO2_02_FULL_57_36]|nr:MAG: hypothetical protein A3I66_05740 [Burkholderiales bacterium RIFCSPLOWO2_02_FULL_57_36]
MYMVYWTGMENGTRTPCSKEFDSNDMGSAMRFMETLRARQRASGDICFVAMASENPDSVGHASVAETGADYNWKKRRR